LAGKVARGWCTGTAEEFQGSVSPAAAAVRFLGLSAEAVARQVVGFKCGFELQRAARLVLGRVVTELGLSVVT